MFTFFVSLYPRRIFNIQNTCIALCDVTIMLDSFVRFILYIEIYIDIREQILDRFHDAAKKLFYCVYLIINSKFNLNILYISSDSFQRCKMIFYSTSYHYCIICGFSCGIFTMLFFHVK